MGTETRQESGMGLAVVEKRGEMAISAMAAKAKAEVEAKFVIALNRPPRNHMAIRQKVLDACKRKDFAEGALYKKPVGMKQINGEWVQQFISGLSIRFAETAIQAMGHISVDTSTIYEDDERRTVHIAVTDLKENVAYGKDVSIDKTVERRNLKKGQEAISQRENSQGQIVYLVRATEDEIANKVAAHESKIIRNCGLRLVPEDILEEAEQQIMSTLESGAKDPLAESKKVADAFASIGVPPTELERYLNHPLATVTSKELVDLRAMYSTIKDGESSWSDYVNARRESPEGTFGQTDPSEAINIAAEAVEKKKEKKEGKKPSATAPAAKPELTVKQRFSILLETGKISFDDAMDFMKAKQIIEDAGSYPDIESLPSDALEKFFSEERFARDLVKIFGAKESK